MEIKAFNCKEYYSYCRITNEYSHHFDLVSCLDLHSFVHWMSYLSVFIFQFYLLINHFKLNLQLVANCYQYFEIDSSSVKHGFMPITMAIANFCFEFYWTITSFSPFIDWFSFQPSIKISLHRQIFFRKFSTNLVENIFDNLDPDNVYFLQELIKFVPKEYSNLWKNTYNFSRMDLDIFQNNITYYTKILFLY